MIRSTWVQIPLRAITVSPQKLSSVEFPLTFSQFLLNLDFESICDPPGGSTLLVQGIYLTDSLHLSPLSDCDSHVHLALSQKNCPEGVPRGCHTLNDTISHVASMVALIV